MGKTLEALHTLEDKLTELLSRYEFLKKENEILFQKVQVLQNKIQEYEQQIANQQEQYNLLKVAKTIDGSEKSTRETKLKINALVREIDKCIVQLNA